MNPIGGNTYAELQVKTVAKNAIGESIATWSTIQNLEGWLDLQSGDSKYLNHNAKIQESTHVFICDYEPIRAKAEESRMIVNGEVYDVMLIDNPMGLNYHIEIYLKYNGLY